MVISRLLDTNTISELSKLEPNPLIMERFKYYDSQIASIAIANGLVLVTRNTKDFESLPTLMLENWFQ